MNESKINTPNDPATDNVLNHISMLKQHTLDKCLSFSQQKKKFFIQNAILKTMDN